MKKILIRIDDICPQMNWHKFYLVLDILQKYHIKPLLGVIPDNKDNELNIDNYEPLFFEKIKKMQDDGFIIAMHGYQHLYDSKNNGNFYSRKLSEFAGHPYDVQNLKIVNGLKIFKDNNLKTEIFMAPGYTLDNITFDVLIKNGFKYVTGGLASKPFTYKGIKVISCREMHKMVNIKIHTLCLHPNILTDEYIKNDLKLYLDKNKKYLISFELYPNLNYHNIFWKFSDFKYRLILLFINIVKYIFKYNKKDKILKDY